MRVLETTIKEAAMEFEDKFRDVFLGNGYSTSSLSEADLQLFRSIIEKHYRNVLKDTGKVTDPALLEKPIFKYHEISEHVDHANLWGKHNRILNKEELAEFMKGQFFSDLSREVGEVLISDEEDVGYPEIYWRLVRPKPFHDVGPLHADTWFWDLGHGTTPPNHQRVKFWFSLWNEAGANGFRYVSNSHTKDYPYTSEVRNGFAKPVFDEHAHDLEISAFNSKPGDFIIFNDKLLHGGLVGGTNTRISFEFTLFLPDEYVEKKFGLKSRQAA